MERVWSVSLCSCHGENRIEVLDSNVRMARVYYGGESRCEVFGPRPRAATQGGAPHVRSIRISDRLCIRQRSFHVVGALLFVVSGTARAVRRIHDYWVVRTYVVAHLVDVKEVADDKITCLGVA